MRARKWMILFGLLLMTGGCLLHRQAVGPPSEEVRVPRPPEPRHLIGMSRDEAVRLAAERGCPCRVLGEPGGPAGFPMSVFSRPRPPEPGSIILIAIMDGRVTQACYCRPSDLID